MDLWIRSSETSGRDSWLALRYRPLRSTRLSVRRESGRSQSARGCPPGSYDYLTNHLDHPFFSRLIIFRIILWPTRVAKATSKTRANSDVVQPGIEFNAATRSTANLAGPSATGCLSICLSTVPQDAVQQRTTLEAHRSQPAQPRSSGPPDKAEVSGSSPLRRPTSQDASD
jgi:hypothetical protein